MRIAILSDDRLFSEGLQRLLVAESSFIVVRDDQRAAELLLIDSRMDGALAQCKALIGHGRPRVILIGAPDDDNWAFEGLRAGARGILTKNSGSEEVIRAIRAVHDGEIWARRRVTAAWIDQLAGTAVLRRAGEAILEHRLSIREREVFRHAASGLGNKELADRLDISEATVKAHLSHIFQKLGVHGRAELAAAFHGIGMPRRRTDQ